MTLAILCSGQGQQHSGMFDLVADAPEAGSLFAVATDLLGGCDPRQLVRNAAPDRLEVNRTAQILCVLQAVALQAVLGNSIPERRIVAGYSVGEVAAWSLAGLINGAQALRLVAARADAMDAASRGAEALTFVRGLPRRTIDVLCEGQDIAVSIVNPGDAFVMGGTLAAIETFELEARRSGAAHVARVKVHVASHTRRLAAASPAFVNILDHAGIRPALAAGVRLFAGIDGSAILDSATGIRKLADQVSHTVEWARCLDSCSEAAASAYIELGPGHALSAMVADSSPGTRVRSSDEFRTLAGLRSWIASAAR